MKRVLIANRGEIAVRIIRTLKDLGIETIAVYSDIDRNSPHVGMADASVALGGMTPAESYLQIDKVIAAAIETGAEGVHPGYGLLSESAPFATACEENGIAFIGPTPEQLDLFGKKHTARELAEQAGVPLVPGTGLLESAEDAVAAAEAIGYPIILKATAGGGGIGMRRCDSSAELRDAYENVRHLAKGNFGDAAVFLEKFILNARHIEVQVFGDGTGQVIVLGERDCSAQRRNQKVIEETPADGISSTLRQRLLDYASRLCASVNYRSAGTVEFVVDADQLDRSDGGDAWFLEVNTRLQVEHGVTEMVHGIDLVEWMVKLAQGETLSAFDNPPVARGFSMEARLYAEDPSDNFAPSPGLITEFSVPENIRCDTWVAAGTDVSPFYDPLLAKLMVHADTREEAREALLQALDETRVAGIETNRALLIDLIETDDFRLGLTTTHTIADMHHAPSTIKILDGGLFTTVQDLPGRIGYWQVGVPPSGPMDERSFRLANELVGNAPSAPALEITLTGPSIKFTRETSFVLGGAAIEATLDGADVEGWTVITAPAGSILECGVIPGPGSRSVLAIAGGFSIPEHLGSASTFVLGGFGGHGGRTLRTGDVLHVAPTDSAPPVGTTLPIEQQPKFTNEWAIEVLPGPHAAPDYFTPEDIETLHNSSWQVHFNSDRTGIRLIGPKPVWARKDGGEAGLHPSNIHDNAYGIGAIDFTGDMPIILGKDGPSLGGFVCPATVTEDEFWKVGQLRAGDQIRFVPRMPDQPNPVLEKVERQPTQTPLPTLTIRRSGDSHLLVEYGENVLDLMLRIRVSALMDAITALENPGILELVPGVRSLQVGFDPDKVVVDELAKTLRDIDQNMPDVESLEIPSRIIRLPLAWDDPSTQAAIEKYMQSVRPDAPWCPSNIEFIRRINGLDSVDEVKRIVYDASYLVLGLGDVYLGAPLSTPIDPRHRLVTTKYNPARTWTAQNTVGIGGSYMCIYGMESPGGYQLVGRTVPIWERWGKSADKGFDKPWLLRFFDQVQWYEVSNEELLEIRSEVEAGRYSYDIEETVFSVSNYLELLTNEAEEIEAFETTRKNAFEEERKRWLEAGIDIDTDEVTPPAPTQRAELLENQIALAAPIPGVVWKLNTTEGSQLEEGGTVIILESMKMETPINTKKTGKLVKFLCKEGQHVQAGETLAIVEL